MFKDIYMSYDYLNMKSLYDRVKPIRGTDIRPLKERTRKHEQVVRVDGGLPGTESYAARLHQTNCIVYHPDDTFSVTHGGWATQSTARFLTRVLPHGVYCVKACNVLWVCDYSREAKYPISSEPVRFTMVNHKVVPVSPMLIPRKLVDRGLTKVIQDKMEPFLRFAKTFLSMSDGWVMHDTIKQHLVPSVSRTSFAATAFLATPSPSGRDLPRGLASPQQNRCALVNAHSFHGVCSRSSGAESFTDYISTMPEEDFLYGLCLLALWVHGARVSGREAETIVVDTAYGYQSKREYLDIQLDYKKLREVLFRYITKRSDIHKIVHVEPSDKFLTKVA